MVDPDHPLRSEVKARMLQVLADREQQYLAVIVLVALGGPAWEFFRFAYGIGHNDGTLDERLHNIRVEASFRDAVGKHRVVTTEADWESPAPSVLRSSRRHGNSSVSSTRNRR